MGTNFAPIARAIGGPNINPRASIPAQNTTIIAHTLSSHRATLLEELICWRGLNAHTHDDVDLLVPVTLDKDVDCVLECLVI